MPRSAGTDDPLALIQYLDLKTYLVGDINTKVDRASMAHCAGSARAADGPPAGRMAGHAAVISLKVRGQEGKFLLKKAMEPHLPHDMLYRPKMGFAVPLARWFRGPLKQRVRDAVLGERLAATGWFNRQLPAAPGRRPPVRHARLQRAAVDAADVRGLPAQRGRRLAERRGRPPA